MPRIGLSDATPFEYAELVSLAGFDEVNRLRDPLKYCKAPPNQRLLLIDSTS